MKLFLITFFATLVFSFFLPYWIAIPISFIVSWFFAKSKKESLLLPGLAVSLAWLSVAIYQLIISNNSKLISKMGALFIGLDNAFSVYFIFSFLVFIAFCIGSLSGFSAFQLKKIFK